MTKSLISRTKDTCGGYPWIAGTRITVYLIKQLYDNGRGLWPKYIIKLYPQLTIKQIQAAINYCSRIKWFKK